MAADYTAAQRAHDQRLNELEIVVAVLLRQAAYLPVSGDAEVAAVRAVGDRSLALKNA